MEITFHCPELNYSTFLSSLQVHSFPKHMNISFLRTSTSTYFLHINSRLSWSEYLFFPSPSTYISSAQGHVFPKHNRIMLIRTSLHNYINIFPENKYISMYISSRDTDMSGYTFTFRYLTKWMILSWVICFLRPSTPFPTAWMRLFPQYE